MSTNSRINSIHVLRFVAAVAVVLHHVTTGLGQRSVLFGAAGVDVFFVISGVVIGISLLDQEMPGIFAARRIIRVMPPYWIATAANVLFKCSVWGMVFTAPQLIRSFFLLPRFGTDWQLIYFPAWTLCYEMLFYAVAFLALIIDRKHALFGCFFAMTVIGMFRIPVPGVGGGAFFSTSLCLEFCAGMAVAPIIRSHWKPSRLLGISMFVIAGAMFWRYQDVAIVINEKVGSFHLTRPLTLGIPSTLLLLGLLAFESQPALRSRLAILGGDASYAIYLCHITVIDFTSDRFARHGIDVKNHFWLSSIALSIASIVVGICAHLFVEKPLLRLLRRTFVVRSR